MTEQEIIELGGRAEDLLQQDFFSTLVSQYEMNCFQHFASTEAKSLKEREGLYNQMRALQDFIGHIRACVAQKNNLLQQQQLSLEDAAHIDGID